MKLFLNEYKSNLGKKYTWLIFIIILSTMFMLAFPIINDPSVMPIVQSNLKDLPSNIVGVFFPYGLETFTDLNTLYRTILIGINIFVCIFALGCGLNSLAREQGFGTIDYIYINPVSRGEIFVKKFVANLINILILIILILLSTGYVFSYVGKVDYMEVYKSQIMNFAIIFVNSIMFLAMGTMISAFAKKTSNLGMINTLIILTFLVLNILISLGIVKLGILAEFVPFRSLQELFNENNIKIAMTLFIGNIIPTLIFILIGYIFYDKKDLII